MSESVGSILGILRLDRSEWSSELKAAGQEARDLSRNSPNINIKTNAGAAITKLAAVAAAAKKLQDAQGAEAVAQQRLTELQDKDGVSKSRLMKAEQDLEKAHRSVAVAVTQLAAAHDGADNSIRKVTRSSEDAKKSMSGLASAALLLGPALIPIAAAGVAAIGGLAATAGTALLAFEGLKKEWAAGQLQGTAFGTQVNALKANIDGLERTAANGVISGLTSGLKDINSLMPSLNNDVKGLSSELGDIAGHTGAGLVALLHTANPLFLALGGYLDQGATAFEQWATKSDGAKAFVQYALDELPVVVQTLRDLATTAGHLIQGFAPLGGTTLRTIDAFSKAINALPIPALQVLATAIVGLVAANRAANAIDLLSTKLTRFSPAVAGAVGALGPVAAVLTAGYVATQAFGKQLDVLANSFATGKIMANQNSSGMDDLKTVYQEITGAVATTSDTLLSFALSAKNSGSGIGELSDESRDVVKHLAALGISAGQIKAAVGGNDATFLAFVQNLKATGQASKDDFIALNDLHESFGNTVTSAGSAAGAVKALLGAQTQAGVVIDGVTYSIDKQTTASGLLKNALDALNGTSLSVEQTQNQFLDTEDQLRASVKQNGASIDQNSTKGRANREVLVSLIQAASAHAQAIADSTAKTKGLSAGTAAGSASFKAQEQQIKNVAHALGLNDQQVAALIAQIGKVPKAVAPKITVHMSGADQVATLKANIAALKSKQIDITTYVQNVIAPTVDHAGQAHGNVSGDHSGPGAHASGGTVGGHGGPKADDQLIYASTGEEVIQEPYASKYRSILKLINAGKFANGGTVGGARNISESAHGGAVEGIIAGVRGQLPNAARAMADLSKAMTDAFKLKGITTQLDLAKSKLSDLRKAADQFGGSVTSNLRSAFNAATAGQDATTGGYSVSALLGQINAQTKTANAFTGQEKHLAALGLNSGYLAQLEQAGPSPTLDLLSNLSKKQIAQVNKAFSAYDSATQGAGLAAEKTIYGPQITAQQKQVNALLAQQKQTQKRVDSLVNAVALLARRPVEVDIDGKAVARATQPEVIKMIDNEMHGLADSLVYGRNS